MRGYRSQHLEFTRVRDILIEKASRKLARTFMVFSLWCPKPPARTGNSGFRRAASPVDLPLPQAPLDLFFNGIVLRLLAQ